MSYDKRLEKAQLAAVANAFKQAIVAIADQTWNGALTQKQIATALYELAGVKAPEGEPTDA